MRHHLLHILMVLLLYSCCKRLKKQRNSKIYHIFMRDFLLFCFFLARLLMYVGAHVNVGMANSFIYKIGKYKEKRTKDVDTSRMGVN